MGFDSVSSADGVYAPSADIIRVSENGSHAYDIVLEKSLDSLPGCMKQALSGCKKVLLVSDSSVAPLYMDKVREVISGAGFETDTFVFPAGEENKTLDTVRDIYRTLADRRFQRGDVLAALGGGVTGDITGFASATYLRGVRFVQIPTTVLACCDSSIGGKTGVDFEGYKNYVGAFHMPSLVYMDMEFMETLDVRQYRAGLSEALKSALIRDRDMYRMFLEKTEQINQKDPHMLGEVIRRSCLIKRQVVEEDPREKGVRAILNFGHTLGHSIEKLMGFSMLHGECVAVGCVAASYISMKRDMISSAEYEEIKELFRALSLPVAVPDELDPSDIVATAHSDKKASGSRIRFILLKGVGNAVIDDTVSDSEMQEALEGLRV
ncbi:MAG: 3-dehydroquinate synthase [Lachnospiraceae bacterium]|nr:3-dehydroquinate synthase [Lachnospiraceae bacterium]